jgi:hypothetical protein
MCPMFGCSALRGRCVFFGDSRPGDHVFPQYGFVVRRGDSQFSDALIRWNQSARGSSVKFKALGDFSSRSVAAPIFDPDAVLFLQKKGTR